MESFGDILVVSSDLEMRRSIVTTLRRLGTDPICASTVSQCREILARQSIALVFCDRRFTDGNYQDLMTAVVSGPRKAKARVVLTTNFISPGEYQEAKRMGIFHVIAAPGNSIAVEWMVILAQRDHLRRWEQASLRPSPNISGSPKIAAAAVKV
jgi:DNA-binding NtrC family response regulator